MISAHSSWLALTPTWTRVAAHLRARPLMLKLMAGMLSSSSSVTRAPSMTLISPVSERNLRSRSSLSDLTMASTAVDRGTSLLLVSFLAIFCWLTRLEAPFRVLLPSQPKVHVHMISIGIKTELSQPFWSYLNIYKPIHSITLTNIK